MNNTIQNTQNTSLPNISINESADLKEVLRRTAEKKKADFKNILIILTTPQDADIPALVSRNFDTLCQNSSNWLDKSNKK